MNASDQVQDNKSSLPSVQELEKQFFPPSSFFDKCFEISIREDKCSFRDFRSLDYVWQNKWVNLFFNLKQKGRNKWVFMSQSSMTTTTNEMDNEASNKFLIHEWIEHLSDDNMCRFLSPCTTYKFMKDFEKDVSRGYEYENS